MENVDTSLNSWSLNIKHPDWKRRVIGNHAGICPGFIPNQETSTHGEDVRHLQTEEGLRRLSRIRNSAQLLSEAVTWKRS